MSQSISNDMNDMNDETFLKLLQDLISSINSESANHNEAIKICKTLLLKDNDNINFVFLQENPNLISSIYEILCILLLHKEDYNGVISFIDEILNMNNKYNDDTNDHKFLNRLKDIRSYASYRCGNYEQAIISSTSSSAEDSDNDNGNSTVKLIEAQSLFHMKQYDKSRELFMSLAEDEVDNDDVKNQLLTNAVAALIADATPYCQPISSTNTTSAVITTVENFIDHGEKDFPYDLAYNISTYKLITGIDKSQSMALLQRAINECAIQNMDDETNYNTEVAPLETNMSIFEQSYWDSNIAPTYKKNNNIPSLVQSVRNVNASSGPDILKFLSNEPDDKLTPMQQRIWYYNRCIAQYQSGLYKECIISCHWLLSCLQKKQKKQVSDNNPTTDTTTTTIKVSNNTNTNNTNKKNTKKGKAAAVSSSTTTTTTATTESATTVTTTSSSKQQKKLLSSLIVQNDNDRIWWDSRLNVLISYCHYKEFLLSVHVHDDDKGNEEKNGNSNHNEEEKKIKKKQPKNSSTTSTTAIDTMQECITRFKDMEVSSIRDDALSYVQLHFLHLQLMTEKTSLSENDRIQYVISYIQNELPVSIQSKLGVKTTLASLYYSTGREEIAKNTILSSSSNENNDQMLADFAMTRGEYQVAVELYEKVISNNSSSDDNAAVLTASLVNALSYTDPKRAITIWNEFRKNNSELFDDDDDIDDTIGIEMENKELPRSFKSKLTVDQDNKNNKKKKKSHDAILRRRARKREAYLHELQTKGLYNPDNPSKPDPERWLPKYERSYNKRRNKNKGSTQHQGGISFKDAEKLDVVARQQARANGEDTASSSRSTAHMNVVGGGMPGRKSKGGGKKR